MRPIKRKTTLTNKSKSNRNILKINPNNKGLNLGGSNTKLKHLTKEVLNKQKNHPILEDLKLNGSSIPSRNIKINKDNNLINENNIETKQKNIFNSDSFPNNNSFVDSDIDEIKSIFDSNDLKKNGVSEKHINESNFFDNSQEKKDQISLKDLDPKIKDVLILFVLSSDYYELLVQERAKKAFDFSKKINNKNGFFN